MYSRNFICCALLVLSLGACNSGTNESKSGNTTAEIHEVGYVIESDGFKGKYNPGDTLSLSVRESAGSKIDSVLYFINDIAIGKAVGNEMLNYDFGSSKFGILVVRAQLYVNGKVEEANVRVDYLPKEEPKLYNYTIINTYPHDMEAYTQGLEFYRSQLLVQERCSGW